jgi:hypothetical protein
VVIVPGLLVLLLPDPGNSVAFVLIAALIVGPLLSLVTAMVLAGAVKPPSAIDDASEVGDEVLTKRETRKKLRKAMVGLSVALGAELLSLILLFPYAGWLSDNSCSNGGGDMCGMAGMTAIFLPIATFVVAGIVGLSVFGAVIAPKLKSGGARRADRVLAWTNLSLWGPGYLILMPLGVAVISWLAH